jgi:predicted aspartyl protease/cytochrome c-type biogenesis protein CcmH/NrfG
MKVYSGKSNWTRSRRIRLPGFILLITALTLSTANVQFADTTAPQQNPKETSSKLNRDAKKAMRAGKYEDAIRLFNLMIDADADDVQARLGASFAYLKAQEYLLSLERAIGILKTDHNNARAHALAGVSLLRAGFVGGAADQFQQAININGKEALAYGGAAEIDYYEGRAKDSRGKALYAHVLDPEEPDYLVTYARASSRLEDFKEAAAAYELYLEIAPISDTERRERIRGLIQFYRQLAGLQVHQISGPSITEVPFHLGNDRRPYVKVKVNGRDAVFVIDTGSGFTVISKDVAKRLGVSEIARGGKSQGIGGNGKFQIVYGLIKSIQLGAVKVKMVPCFVRAFHSDKDRPAEERADGFIGLSILSHFLTELDYKEARIRLDRTENSSFAVPTTPDVTIVPFRTTQNGLISVETEFDGNQNLNVILDSGASSTVISTAAVERLNLGDQIIKNQTASVIGAAGVTENVKMLFVRKCRLAGLQQTNLRALVLDFGAINETAGFEQSGILGGDFLRNFRLTIDFNRALLAFQPHTPAETHQ